MAYSLKGIMDIADIVARWQRRSDGGAAPASRPRTNFAKSAVWPIEGGQGGSPGCIESGSRTARRTLELTEASIRPERRHLPRNYIVVAGHQRSNSRP